MSKQPSTSVKTAIDHVKIAVTFLVGAIWVLGLSPTNFSFERGVFQHSKFMWTYSLTCLTLVTIVYVPDIIDHYTQTEFAIRDAEKLYNTISIISMIITYVYAMINSSDIMNFMNRVQLYYVMEYFQLNIRAIAGPLAFILGKALVFPVVMSATMILRQIYYEPERSLLWTLYKILPGIIAGVHPSCFFGALIVSQQCMLALNKRLDKIVQEVNWMQTKLQMNLQKPYYRMQRFCQLADELDQLSAIFVQICEQTSEFINLVSITFICSLIGNIFCITAGCFTHYQTIADVLINEEPYDVFNSLTNSVFLIVAISDIALEANFSNQNFVETKYAGIALERMNLLYADIRFKQSVEAFALKAFVMQYKIEPLGLFEVNLSLLHNVLSTVMGFLLIMIQSDLTIRFSLK